MYFQKKIVHQTALKKLEPYHPNAPRNRPKETVQDPHPSVRLTDLTCWTL